MWKLKKNGSVRGIPNQVTHSLLYDNAHNETNFEYPDDWLTMQHKLFYHQLDAQNCLFTYNKFIKILYMF
jgi:hypothetical protein